MKEGAGRAILREIFEGHGLSMIEDAEVTLGTTQVVLDGWDETRRVGYEVLTSEAGDREAFPPAVVAELESAMRRGEATILLIDLDPSEELLRRAAQGFLSELKKRGTLP